MGREVEVGSYPQVGRCRPGDSFRLDYSRLCHGVLGGVEVGGGELLAAAGADSVGLGLILPDLGAGAEKVAAAASDDSARAGGADEVAIGEPHPAKLRGHPAAGGGVL